MRCLEIDIEGDISYCVQDAEIERVVNFYTSGYDGTINAYIYLGNFRDFEGQEIVVTSAENGEEDGELGLVRVEKNFICLINYEFINREEIDCIVDPSSPMTIMNLLLHLNIED